jgi:hypothetical protein
VDVKNALGVLATFFARTFFLRFHLRFFFVVDVGDFANPLQLIGDPQGFFFLGKDVPGHVGHVFCKNAGFWSIFGLSEQKQIIRSISEALKALAKH